MNESISNMAAQDDVIVCETTVAPGARGTSASNTIPGGRSFTLRSIVATARINSASGGGFVNTCLPPNAGPTGATNTMPTLEDVTIALRIDGVQVFASPVPMSTFANRGALRFVLDAPIPIGAGAKIDADFVNRTATHTIDARAELWGISLAGKNLT